MNNYKGVQYLESKLNSKRARVLTRYRYYEQKESKYSPSPVIPPNLKGHYLSTLGWCAKSVDFLADRLVVDGFENDNFNFEEIFNMNNPDTIYDSAILSALISSCCFISISADLDGYPRLEVIDGGNATGVIDPNTGLLKEGYAVLERDEHGNPSVTAYYTEGNVTYNNHGEIYSIPNPVKHPLLVPIINRPDAVRPFGHSRISRTCMDLQDKARETIMRTEISSEFYSFPQKYILGLAQDVEPLDGKRASISSFLQIFKDDDGDHPVVGQFNQQSVEPHISQFKLYASAFCGETGLSLDDIGFISNNPSSAEAIKAAHESLRNTARRAQRNFGRGFVNAGYLAACLRDGFPYERKEVYNTSVRWSPIIEPDTATLSMIGDGAIKINQAIPGYFGVKSLEHLTGIKAEEQ